MAMKLTKRISCAVLVLAMVLLSLNLAVLRQTTVLCKEPVHKKIRIWYLKLDN